jgi:hypothetical protein
MSAGGTSATSTVDQFTFVPAPSVSSVSPNNGTISGGTSVTITGAHLSGATAVEFGGTATGFTVNSDTSITAYSPAGESPDTVDVTVTTTGGTSAASVADQFTYTAVPAPSVSNVSPNSGPVTGGTMVTIAGTGFTNATEVDFGGIPAGFTVNDDTSISAYSPSGSAAAPVDVAVISAGGSSAASVADQFTYTP